MNKAVPAEQEISMWQLCAGQIDYTERSVRRQVVGLAVFDQIGEQITADVLDSLLIDFLHPVKVSTRDVQQGSDPKLVQENRQLATDRDGSSEVGTGT
jgi:hypothetical protein